MAIEQTDTTVLQTRDGGVVLLTLNRPARLNAITGELLNPVIAEVNGPAAGAGFALALAADLRIAAESASFAMTFVRIGFIPDAGSTYFLPRLIGSARAAEMMMLGDTVDAGQAMDLGLVSKVVPDTELLTAAGALASRLAAGPFSIGFIKEA